MATDKGKDGFVLYKSMYGAISGMSDEKLGMLMRAIYEWQLSGGEEINVEDLEVRMALQFFINQFNIDNNRYRQTCENNRGSINKRWEREKSIQNDTNDTNVYERTESIQNDTNDTDKDKDKDINIISPDGECEEQAQEGNSSLPTSEPIPYRKICDMWNETADKVPGIPKVAKLTDARKGKIAQRVREMGEKDIGKAMETYGSVLDRIPKSPFFTEKWQPNFDWLFANGSNWVKILEGNYAGTSNQPRSSPPREPTRYTSMDEIY